MTGGSENAAAFSMLSVPSITVTRLVYLTTSMRRLFFKVAFISLGSMAVGRSGL